MDIQSERQSFWLPLREIAPNWKHMARLKRGGESVHAYIVSLVFENYETLLQHLETFQIYNYRISLLFKKDYTFDLKTMKINSRNIYIRRGQQSACKVNVIGMYVGATIKEAYDYLSNYGEVVHIEENYFIYKGKSYKNHNFTVWFTSRNTSHDFEDEDTMKFFYSTKSWEELPEQEFATQDVTENIETPQVNENLQATQQNESLKTPQTDETRNQEMEDDEINGDVGSKIERYMEEDYNQIMHFNQIKGTLTKRQRKWPLKLKDYWELVWTILILANEHKTLQEYEQYPHYCVTAKYFKKFKLNYLFKASANRLKKYLVDNYNLMEKTHKVKH